MTAGEEKLRPELKLPLPERMRDLPVYRGYPVPWFVAWIKGVPEFRAGDAQKWAIAVQTGRCWVCGQKLGAYLAFVLGPMCAITRSTSEPACHRECAQWSIENCPFLARPHMTRRENGLPEGLDFPGQAIRRNPGVSALWITRDFKVVRDDHGRPLLSVGQPFEVAWFFEGRPATLDEIETSIAGGMPGLEELAKPDGAEGERALAAQLKDFLKLLPLKESGPR